MEAILSQISANPFFAFIVECATLISLIIAIVVPIIQKKRKVLSVEYDTKALVKGKISEIKGLEILYDNNPIEQLAVTIIRIRNRGNVLIESKDVYQGHELKIMPKEKLKIYDTVVGKQSSDTIECAPKNLNDCVEVHFQAFEINDTVEINVFHNGNENSSFMLEGKIKECKISNFDAYAESVFKRIEPVIRWSLSIGIATLLASVLQRLSNWINSAGDIKASLLIIGLLIITVTLALMILKILEKLIYWFIAKFISHS